MYFVYILLCSNGSLYIGHTRDVTARIRAHEEGRGAAHTFKYRPLRLVFSEPHPTKPEAVRRERQLKRWSHAKKEALIRGDVVRLRALSKRRH
jgi:predicted GIY-YIG superfamily endonuclease